MSAHPPPAPAAARAHADDAAAARAPLPANRPKRGAPLAFAAVVIGNISLGFGPWLVRSADVGPEASAFWRMVIAAPLLAVAVLVRRERLPRLDGRFTLVLLLAGLFFALDLAFWHIGLLHTRLGNASLFANITSFAFPIYGYLVARRWPTRRSAIALMIAAAGVLLLAGQSYELSPGHLRGDLFCILAGLTYTGYLIVLEEPRTRVPPLTLLLLAVIATTPFLGVIAGLSPHPFWPHHWTPLILLAIGNQLIGQGALLFALGELPPIIVGLSLMIQPIANAFIGWTVYGERLGLLDVIGALLIGTALVLVRGRD